MVLSALPAAIVFDLDGTIVDTETVEYESIRDVWAEHGVEYSLAMFEHVIGTSSGPLWIDGLTRALGSERGRLVDPTSALGRRRTIQAAMLAALGPRDGVVALIEEAAIAGIPLAIASNSPLYWVQERLAAAGLTQHFEALATIDTVTRPKPDPEPYLQACTALGADPAASVAFEDSVVGVRSAVAAGLYTVACAGPLTAGHDLSAADMVITSHTDITIDELSRALAGRAAMGR